MHEPTLSRGGSSSMSAAPPRTSVPLIDSITRLPYGRVMEDQSYVVSGAAMNEIIEELRNLWNIRQALVDLKAAERATT